MEGKPVCKFVTVEDRYYALLEEVKNELDDPAFAPLHTLIEKIMKGVREIADDKHIRQKVDKVLRVAIESRVTRQIEAGENGRVKTARTRHIPNWRDL